MPPELAQFVEHLAQPPPAFLWIVRLFHQSIGNPRQFRSQHHRQMFE